MKVYAVKFMGDIKEIFATEELAEKYSNEIMGYNHTPIVEKKLWDEWNDGWGRYYCVRLNQQGEVIHEEVVLLDNPKANEHTTVERPVGKDNLEWFSGYSKKGWAEAEAKAEEKLEELGE